MSPRGKGSRIGQLFVHTDDGSVEGFQFHAAWEGRLRVQRRALLYGYDILSSLPFRR
jgi:hypothetical protein